MADSTAGTGSSFVYRNSEISITGKAPAAAVLYAEAGNTITLNAISLTGIDTDVTGPIHIIGSNLDINNGTFIQNSAGANGAVIYIEKDGNVNIIDSIFSNNSAEIYGGGIYISDNSNVNIKDCIFEDNHADFGGAIALDVGQGSNEQNIVNIDIEDSLFHNNSAVTSGGALYAKLFSARLEDAETFSNNIKL